MATTQAAESVSLVAGAAFAVADVGRLCKVSAANTAIKIAAITDPVVGIIGEAVPIGATAPIILLKGIVKVKAGGTITAGQLLIPAADGDVTGAASIAAIPANAMSIGIALEAGADGELISALSMPLVSPAAA